jgi:hypothetical protein
MITVLSAMRWSRIEKRIIGKPMWGLALLLAFTLLAGGCSSITLAYNNGPQLAWWWIDGYFDFSREQTPSVKRALDELFDWHRVTQLPGYLTVLTQARAEVLEPTTAATACRWQTQVREALEPTLERALQQAADVVPTLGEPQFAQLSLRYAKVLKQMRDDFLQPDPAERLRESVKRVEERAVWLYGRLDAAQQRVIKAGVAASPYNPELWLTERQRRQADTLQTLRRLVADKADREQRVAALRTLVGHTERSPDAEYRAYQLKLADYNCAFAAQVHNATSAAQRQRALKTLKGWEGDIKALSAGG